MHSGAAQEHLAQKIKNLVKEVQFSSAVKIRQLQLNDKLAIKSYICHRKVIYSCASNINEEYS